jgi:hypothetical protein
MLDQSPKAQFRSCDSTLSKRALRQDDKPAKGPYEIKGASEGA